MICTALSNKFASVPPIETLTQSAILIPYSDTPTKPLPLTASRPEDIFFFFIKLEKIKMPMFSLQDYFKFKDKDLIFFKKKKS